MRGAALAFLAVAASGCWHGLENVGPFPCGSADGACPPGYWCDSTWTCQALIQLCSDSKPCAVGSVCIATYDGSVCSPACSVPGTLACASGSGTDCKLVLAGDRKALVAACQTSGTGAAGDVCANVNDCGVGRSCALNNAQAYVCFQLCTMPSPVCRTEAPNCKTVTGVPSDWGYCST